MATTIGVLSGFVAGPYPGLLIPAIARVVAGVGGRVVAVQTVATGIDYHQEVALKDLAHVGWSRIDGFVTIANAVPREYLEALREAGKPVVSIGYEEPGFACPSVLADNAGGAKRAVEHLLAHGHRRVAFVGRLDEFDINQRYEGYCSALLAHGLQPDPELLFPAPNDLEDGGRAAAKAMMAAGLRSTAVFAATDLNAVGIMRVLTAAGLKLPGDQAVAGFDDDPDAALSTPSLSTVAQDLAQMGGLAAELLLELVSGRPVRPGCHLVATSYLARESCGCTAVEEGRDDPERPSDAGALADALALLTVRNDAYYELRQMVRDHYEITVDLLYNPDRDPRLLDWLESTEARAGVLGLWRHRRAVAPGAPGVGAGPGVLDMAGTFDVSGGRLPLSSQSSDVESFPPEELFAAGKELQVVFLFPLKSGKADWGFLAIAQPLVACLEQEAYFAWSAFFSEALYQRELLHSLSQRSDELAISYQREKEMAGAVRESEQRYALAAQAANDGLWDWDLASGTIYLSSRLREMLGVQGADIDNNPDDWFKGVHPEDSAGLVAKLSALKTGEITSMTCEYRARASDGRYLWVLCRGLAVPGLGAPATRIVGSITDVTDRRSLEERLRRQALYDNLTGLPNRELFLDRLSQAMAGAKRQPGPAYTVLWLDLDNFKRVNDTLGHLYGDELLVQVAERIRGHVRESDTAARFGGDEFVLLLHGTNDGASVEPVVSRLSEHLNQPYVLRGQTVSVTASIGFAVGGAEYEFPDEILRNADTAMYSAKSSGRGSYAAY